MGMSEAGRAHDQHLTSPCQGEGRGFESRRPLAKVLVESYISGVSSLALASFVTPLGRRKLTAAGAGHEKGTRQVLRKAATIEKTHVGGGK
jgi:hypothetical protein